MPGNDTRLQAIEEKLDDHGRTLKGIQKTLNTIAVQSEQIATLQGDVTALWRKFDELTNLESGVIPRLQRHQASCPRYQIKWLWTVVVPMGVSLLAVAIRFVRGGG